MFIPLWLILTVSSGLLSNFYNFLNRVILKDNEDPTVSAWYTEILRFVIFSLIAIVDWKLVLTPQSFIILLFVGLTEFLGGYFYMKMHAYTHLSISTILSRTRLIWVPIIGFFLFHEILKTSDYAGIIIIFIGISTIIAPKKLFVDKGAIYANLYAFIIAFNVILLKLATPYTSNAVLMAIMPLPAVLFYPVVMKDTKVRLKKFTKANMLLKSFTVTLSIIFLYLSIAALRLIDASIFNAIYQGMLFFAVLAGIIFLKERQDIKKKLIGATITIVGVTILSFL
jgi:uncharacterized membrane protein